ncbi:MAG: serine/threonine-protein phosphatase [Cyanobacteria bacterium J007]|nr:MAG: serine/threonine-protein phosphatase [Cyanobacteria bacterium J007]
MSSSEPSLYCPNTACANPANPLGNQQCDSCQTPLTYRYLWGVGAAAMGLEMGETIADRYYVVAPQIFLDTQPSQLPLIPNEIPEELLPYLQLYPQRLHVPQIYGFCTVGQGPQGRNFLLLENVPVDPNTANLYPSLLEAWGEAPPVRQVYWLWQILQLWRPLLDLGVASSLLKAENIRVQGWRVWLRELYSDATLVTKPDAQDLGYNWLTWTGQKQGVVGDRLQEIGKQMRRPDADLASIETQVNQLLLELAGQLPLRVRVAGGSDPGPQRTHNEDCCFPTTEDLPEPGTKNRDRLLGHLAIVCDGVGGHEGGEVASQMAVQSLKLPIRAFMEEVLNETELSPPTSISDQLRAIARVVNNTIAAQNDQQGRALRQRMGTTLMMALQLPQTVATETGARLANSHELYLVSLGDSRAYWITPHYCQQLSVDDDLVTREVRMGRSFYRDVLKRREAGALTQALGTREGDLLHPNVSRFIVEEDGLLLLCSDGLSDNDRVEQFWHQFCPHIFNGDLSVEQAVQRWIDLANDKNGHDNTSVVLTYYRLSPEKLVLFDPTQLPSEGILDDEFAESSRALLDEEETPDGGDRSRRSRRPLSPKQVRVRLLLVGLLAAIVGFVGWWQLDESGAIDRLREQIFRQE